MSTILIVEDNDKNMKLARDILNAKGYATLEAVTGEEGVKLSCPAYTASRPSARSAATRRPRAFPWWRSPPR